MSKVYAFKTEEKAKKALDQINKDIGCPIISDNGYKMESWSDVNYSEKKEYYYFSVVDEKFIKDLTGKDIKKYKKLETLEYDQSWENEVTN